MISSHELQQTYINGGNCGHKKSPSRMPVELLCVRRRGGKRTQRRARAFRPHPKEKLGETPDLLARASSPLLSGVMSSPDKQLLG